MVQQPVQALAHKSMLSSSRAGLTQWLVEALSALLLFLLLREWLIPLGELPTSVKLYHIPIFIAAMGSFIAMNLLRLPFAIDLILRGASILLWVAVLYYPNQFPLDGWWAALGELLVADWKALWQGAPEQVSGAARTLLFLAGMAMLIYVLHSLVLLKKSMLWLTILTLIYLLLLHAGYGVDTTPSMVRGLGAGLLLASLASLAGKMDQASVIHRRWLKGWLAGAGLIIALCLGTGWGGYQLAPSVAEAMKLHDRDWTLANFMPESMKRKLDTPIQPTNGTSIRSSSGARTGYSSNDSRLGGPLTSDSAIVFAAWTEEVAYWRGESKSYYDGRGWSQSAIPSDTASGSPGSVNITTAAVESDRHEAGRNGRVIVQQVLLTERAPANRLFAAGTIRQAESLILNNGRPADEEDISIDPVTGASTLTASIPLQQYSVEVFLPERGGEPFLSGFEPYPHMELEPYLQLPSTLPERVRQLAVDLTIDYENDYDKAKSIEHFLRTSYTYTLEEAVVPPAGEDFVDYFLFEQPLGYCDYFSTSMVVLLRAAGIPARWVKGFAPGEISLAISDGSDEAWEGSEAAGNGYLATVRNSDAHSWPEVYLQEHGWVAFEPTPGFAEQADTASLNISLDNDKEHADELLHEQSQEGGASDGENGTVSNGLSEAQDSWRGVFTALGGLFSAATADALLGYFKGNADIIVWGIAGILIAALAVWGWKVWRDRRSTTFKASLQRGIDRTGPAKRGLKRLDKLWLRLYQKRGPRSAHLTLREYVSALGLKEDEIKSMTDLARWDEEVRYGRRPSAPMPDSTVWKSWFAVIKRMAKSERNHQSRNTGH